jgi:hypothetical protein
LSSLNLITLARQHSFHARICSTFQPLWKVFYHKFVVEPTNSSLEPMRKLSEDDVKSLWNIFSRELSKVGIDPEMHRKIFNNILNPYKSYDENMRNILEEVRNITNKSAK